MFYVFLQTALFIEKNRSFSFPLQLSHFSSSLLFLPPSLPFDLLRPPPTSSSFLLLLPPLPPLPPSSSHSLLPPLSSSHFLLVSHFTSYSLLLPLTLSSFLPLPPSYSHFLILSRLASFSSVWIYKNQASIHFVFYACIEALLHQLLRCPVKAMKILDV